MSFYWQCLANNLDDDQQAILDLWEGINYGNNWWFYLSHLFSVDDSMVSFSGYIDGKHLRVFEQLDITIYHGTNIDIFNDQLATYLQGWIQWAVPAGVKLGYTQIPFMSTAQFPNGQISVGFRAALIDFADEHPKQVHTPGGNLWVPSIPTQAYGWQPIFQGVPRYDISRQLRRRGRV